MIRKKDITLFIPITLKFSKNDINPSLWFSLSVKRRLLKNRFNHDQKKSSL